MRIFGFGNVQVNREPLTLSDKSIESKIFHYYFDKILMRESNKIFILRSFEDNLD